MCPVYLQKIMIQCYPWANIAIIYKAVLEISKNKPRHGGNVVREHEQAIRRNVDSQYKIYWTL